VAIALAGDERVARVVGVDLSEGMLDLARAKVSRRGLSDKVSLVRGDVLALDVPDNSVDAITVGFGVRNFSDLMKGLKEAYRVLKPGGRIIILEFSMPASWFLKAFYGFYLNCCVPLIGAICTGRLSAYNYLVRTIMAFPSGENFSRILSQAGFKAGVRHPLMFGIVTVYTAER
jgi:demethylmenaquinone methyltransferase/2-methoxy-6-polyprenyl-1,4-benzoquinol methylase